MEQALRHHFMTSRGFLTATSFGVLVSMYYWAYTPMQAIVGVMTDRFGPKRILTVAIGLCALGVFIFGDTTSIYIAGLGRFMVGVGSAFAFVGVLKLAAMWLPERYFPVFTGITTSLGMLGALCGDIGMTSMVHSFGWHKVISVSVIAGVLLIPIFYLFVHEKIVHEPVKRPNDSFKVFFKHFVTLLKNKDILIAGVIGCLMYMSLSTFGEMWGIPFIQREMHGSGQHLAASTINAAVFFGWLVGAPLMGILSQKLRTRRKLLMYGSLAAAGVFGTILMYPNLTPIEFGALLSLFGICCSAQILCFVVGRDYVDVKLAATAAGVINMLIMASGMLLQPLISKMLDWAWSGQMAHGLRVYSVNDYRLALTSLPVALVISAILAYFMKESYKKEA